MLSFDCQNQKCGAFVNAFIPEIVNDVASGLALKRCLAEFGVIVFRKQSITADEFIRFSQLLGATRLVGRSQARLRGQDQIAAIATQAVTKGQYGISHVGTYWHTDLSYETSPPAYTCLYCIETPDFETLVTEFASLLLATEALQSKDVESFKEYHAVHDLAMSDRPNFPGRNPHQPKPIKDRSTARAKHKLLQHHPESQKLCLYFNPGLTAEILDQNGQEVTGLKARLAKHVMQPDFRYRHKWSAGDLIVWDNRVVIHKAPVNYGPEDRRLLWRTVIDDRPVHSS